MRAMLATVCLLVLSACGGSGAGTAAPAPWILLITLDTTRADAMGPETTPAFEAIARAGRRFTMAHATAPETLPSHTSIMTGLYPGGHGIHENGRAVPAGQRLLAEDLRAAGYQTAAVVSSYVLARRFGLIRGFGTYEDGLDAGQTERRARATTGRARDVIRRFEASAPAFLWVHYFDAHAPYQPPDPYRARFADRPYHGEVAYADAEMGELIAAFTSAAQTAGREAAIIVTSDHGEGLGDHGEETHGHLVYQSTMRVPLAMAGPGVDPGVVDTPVSLRRVYHTVLDWAGRPSPDSLRASTPTPEVVVGEAMKPFLQYGWQPQIMAVDGATKAILAGRVEVYDLAADPGEQHDLRTGASLAASLRTALDEYPVPSLSTPAAGAVDAEARQKLASLGYVAATSTPVVRRDAPRPVDMTRIFPLLDTASNLFVQNRYREVVPVLQQILAADPNHLDATLRLATAYSGMANDAAAMDYFRRASSLAPESQDVRMYLALHLARTPRWTEAVPVLESIVAAEPDRVVALEGLAVLRERQGRPQDRLALMQKVYALRPPSGDEAVRTGLLAMSLQDTPAAIAMFERAREVQGRAFAHHLELGVLYQASQRYADARLALDQVPASHPDYPMALFKRAQVSVLLGEPDRLARIDAARRNANAITRPLIDNERLFR